MSSEGLRFNMCGSSERLRFRLGMAPVMGSDCQVAAVVAASCAVSVRLQRLTGWRLALAAAEVKYLRY